MSGFIRITSRPSGEAPPAIRDQWIGLLLPVKELVGEGERRGCGVLTYKPNSATPGDYVVTWQEAMTALETKSRETRDWWEEKARCSALIFEQDCCEPVPD